MPIFIPPKPERIREETIAPFPFHVKPMDIFLQGLDKHAGVISVAYSMMNLYGHGQYPPTRILEGLSQCKNGKKIFAVVKNMEMKGGKCNPRYHGYIERIGRPARLRRIAGGRSIGGSISFVGL